MHLLARQPIELDRPHPFTAAGNTEFNCLLWMAPEEERAGDIVLVDSTHFTTLFGVTESLQNFWRNIATMKMKAALRNGMTDTYDLVAIGAGPAGESATELAAFFGHRSAVIEKAQPGRHGDHDRRCADQDASRGRAVPDRFSRGRRVRAATWPRPLRSPRTSSASAPWRYASCCKRSRPTTSRAAMSTISAAPHGSTRRADVIVSGARGRIAPDPRQGHPDCLRFAALPAEEHLIRDPWGLRHRHHLARWAESRRPS